MHYPHSSAEKGNSPDSNKSRIILAQPRAPYGYHVMTPGPLWVAGARLLQAFPDLDISFQDANLYPLQTGNAEIIGFNVLGAPNFPEILHLQHQLVANQQMVLGGQVIQSLGKETRERVFGLGSINENESQELSRVFNINVNALLSEEETSLIPVYKRIPDHDMREYMTRVENNELKPREVAFFLSQGCAFNCSFCAAVKKTPERYRQPDVLENDLRYLMQKAEQFGVLRLEMYISNLDLFQTPRKLAEFAALLMQLKAQSPGFTFGMRGLATTKSFVDCYRKEPHVVEAIQKAGLHTLGFGIDGTPAVWKRIRKGHNDESDNLLAVQLCREHGITPEVLMVLGQPQETPEELEAAFQITKKFADEEGSTTRPHVWKPLPGSDVWKDFSRSKIMNLLLQDPDGFTAFDVLAEASPVSHADEDIRKLVNAYFERYLQLPSNRTAAIKPLGWWLSDEEKKDNRIYNQDKCDR